MPPKPLRRILVLDDDEVLRDLLEALLTMEGYRVTLASSGEQALALLQSEPTPELVLTDINMPGLEGEALATELRANLPAGALLIGMSASPQPQSTRAVLDAFVPKPFDAAALNAAILVAQNHEDGVPPPAAPVSALENNPEAAPLPPLDEAVFTALAARIPASQLGQLYSMTLDDILNRHQRMVAAAAAGDHDTLRREAHTVKGSCGFVGASELQALAASLETGTTSDTSTLDEIPAACLRLRSMLKYKIERA